MPGQRRSYPKSFKAQVVDECTQPGASVAGVALSHGLNANLVHKWIRRQQAQLPAVPSSFIPIPLVPSLPATPSAADMAIQIAIPHRAGNLYRIWNRLCSGSYFPPPFGAVERTGYWRWTSVRFSTMSGMT
ncbi:transposase [Pseudomonas sp. D(2018)]|uniref:IS66-like element accessory protein TnpA n=1 Tax=Pseudomonas sp. D(2018) TaxID=2502238 RepID=UPI002115821C|nr:transposase [Pseudomonas sp. D(2018)]